MAKLVFWIAVWDADFSRWHPLGCRPRFELTADLIPVEALGRLGLSCCDVGIVRCGQSWDDAVRAFAALPRPHGIVVPTVH